MCDNVIKEVYSHLNGDIDKDDYSCNFEFAYTNNNLQQAYTKYRQKPDGAYECKEFVKYNDGKVISVTKGCSGEADGRFCNEKDFQYKDGKLVKYTEGVKKVSDVIWEKRKEITFENDELKTHGEGFIRLIGGDWIQQKK